MRKRQAKKRPLLPDPKFNDQLVTRFVNMLMWDGKKSIAFNIFYDAMNIVDERNVHNRYNRRTELLSSLPLEKCKFQIQ